MADEDPRITRAQEWMDGPDDEVLDVDDTADVVYGLLAFIAEQPTIEIHHELGKPTTCKIMRGGRVIFWGTSLEHRFPELRGPDHG